MPTDVVLGDEELSPFATASHGAAEPIPFTLASPISIEDTVLTLGLVALDHEQITSEYTIRLSVRARIDDMVQLWDREFGALSVVMTASPMRPININLSFRPAGHPILDVIDDLTFMTQLSEAGTLAIRLPDQELSKDRIVVADQLALDAKFARSLQLLADVAELSKTNPVVPEEFNRSTISNLITARRLLQGQPGHGRWRDASLRIAESPLGETGLRELVSGADRHQLMLVSDLDLDIGSTFLTLPNVRQVFENAIVESLERQDDELVLTIKGGGGDGSSPLELYPDTSVAAEQVVGPRVILPSSIFDEIVDDLAQPARSFNWRDLL